MNTELLIWELELMLHSIQKNEADLMSAGCERPNQTHLRSSEAQTLRDEEQKELQKRVKDDDKRFRLDAMK